jgi:hypothetical protein
VKRRTNVSPCLIKQRVLKIYRTVEVSFHAFLTRSRWVVKFTPRFGGGGKDPHYQMGRWLDGPQTQ